MNKIAAYFLLAALTMSALWATDPLNPKPCKDPWECYEKPEIDGIPRGTSTICPGGNADISVYDDITPGKKIRCDEEEEVGVTEIEWSWTVTGPESDSGDGDYIGRTWTKPGTYKAVFTGTASSADSICSDPDDATAEFEFTVSGPSFTVTLNIDPATICPGETATATGTITDTSSCDFPPYVVKWRIENTGGNVQLTMAPDNGSETIAPGESKEVEITITKNADASGGISSFTFTGTTDFSEQAATDDLMTVKLLSVSHGAPDYQPWTQGVRAPASAEIEGELGDKEILYEAVNVHTGGIGGSVSDANTSTSIPIDEPGRYRVQASLCDKTVVNTKPFVCWTATLTPVDHKIKWDAFADVKLNPEEWKAVLELAELASSTLTLALNEAKRIRDVTLPAVQQTSQELINQLTQLPAKIDSALSDLRTQRNQLLTERAGVQFEILAKEADIRIQQVRIPFLQARIDRNAATIQDLERRLAEADNPGLRAALERQLANARQRLAQATAELSAVQDEIRTIRAAIDGLNVRLADLGRRIDDLVRGISILTNARPIAQNIATATIDLVRSAAKFDSLHPQILALARRAGTELVGALPLIGAALDTVTAVNAMSEHEKALAKAQENVALAHQYMEAHKEAFDKWKDTPAKRLTPPQIVNLTLTTVPGAITGISFYENGTYLTKDSTIPMAEGPPWLHFSFIGGDKECWDNQFDPEKSRKFTSSTGATGQVALGMFLYGNLGYSQITAQIQGVSGPNMKAKITSDGTTEERLIEIVHQMSAEEQQKADELAADAELVSGILAGLSVALFAVALGVVIAAKFLGAAIAVALSPIIATAALIVGIAGVVVLAVGYILSSIFGASELEDSILELFPETNG